MDEEDDKRNRKKIVAKATITPTPADMELFQFLEHCFWEENCPDKIVVRACHGAVGSKFREPALREFAYKPNDKPDRIALIERSNEISQISQTDCDRLGRPTRYAVLAYDAARSDQAIGRIILAVRPSGMLSDEDNDFGDEETSAGSLSSKLLLGLLDSERQDKRWMAELSMKTLAQVIERNDERMKRMEQIVDGAWQKQVQMMKATEDMLSQAQEREAKAAAASWKQAKFDFAIQKGWLLAEKVLPMLADKSVAADPAAPQGNLIADFMNSVSSEQGDAAFGAFDEENKTVAGGVFSNEQFQMLLLLRTQVDDKVADQLVASITPEQTEKARQIFDMSQLMLLVKWMNSRQAAQANVQ